MVGEIAYSYVPDDWDQEKFLALGGFTVVFLNYNKASFIERSVASALNQDFPLCEMFFMDDASTDGSGDTMERLVRAYRGRHKVTVVRNTENQRITGQWNIVSKLATGNWLGMFCGDDIAYPDRVTKAAAIVSAHPTLKGFCTGASAIDVRTGGRRHEPQNREGVIVYRGGEGLWNISTQSDLIFGATAWWHKSLFDVSLKFAPLDDVHLRWVLQAKYALSSDEVWLCAGRLETIEYSVGCGVSSEMNPRNDIKRGSIEQWLLNTEAMRKFYQLMIQTYEGVESYFRENKIGGDVNVALGLGQFKFRALNGNTFKRVCLLPRLIALTMNRRIPRSVRKSLHLEYSKFFIQELFGLRVASVLSTCSRLLGCGVLQKK